MERVKKPSIRLGVNIDHIATLRQLRAGTVNYPDLVVARDLAVDAGAEQITIHLRGDRRHIQDADVTQLCGLRESHEHRPALLNLEMAATTEMIEVALREKPDWVCLVPEKREEVTTEGGLDVVTHHKSVEECVRRLKPTGIKISLFIEADEAQTRKSAELGAHAVEFHTGSYAIAYTREGAIPKSEFEKLKRAFKLAHELKLGVHAGHGLDYVNVTPLISDPYLAELNIGHSIVCRAALVGLGQAVREMKDLLR